MFEKINIPITIDDKDLTPTYQTEGSAGCDVRASLLDPVEILPGASAIIPTGMRIEIPNGYEVQVRPRSGLAAKHQITVLNTPGTIDADFRGEICIILINHGKKTFIIEPKMRIAQLVLAPVFQAEFVLKKSLQTSNRGEGGFGSTGTH